MSRFLLFPFFLAVGCTHSPTPGAYEMFSTLVEDTCDFTPTYGTHTNVLEVVRDENGEPSIEWCIPNGEGFTCEVFDEMSVNHAPSVMFDVQGVWTLTWTSPDLFIGDARLTFTCAEEDCSGLPSVCEHSYELEGVRVSD